MWDCLKDKKEKKKVQENLLESIKLWKNEGDKQQTIIIFDDVSQQMSQGEFTSLENLFMNGKHERVDVVVIYHGNPDSSKQSLKVMRSNVKCIFLTGMSHIDSTYRYSGWVDKGSYSKAEFTQRAQSFIKQRIRCGLILKRLRDETPLEEHFIHFRAYLGKRYKNDIEHGLVGENDDASSIIKGTGAEIAIREELKAQMKRYEARSISSSI